MILEDVWKSFKVILHGTRHIGAVAYIDLTQLEDNPFSETDRTLVFSGITSSWRTSTINDAETIVEKISKQEGIKPSDRDFYDLQTCKGYPSYKSGQFELNKLSFKTKGGKIADISWKVFKADKVNESFRLFFLPLIEG